MMKKDKRRPFVAGLVNQLRRKSHLLFHGFSYTLVMMSVTCQEEQEEMISCFKYDEINH